MRATNTGNQERIKAFVLTMRYTGLRIGDAIRLSTSQVTDGKLFVRTAKTGQPVTIPVPPDVVKSLDKIATSSERYFWTGKNIRSAVSNWSRYLARVFDLAKISDGHSHRFRDTCAVELLLAGASVEDVASVLGNTPHVVAKHYAPWVKERQVRLEKLVRQSWVWFPLFGYATSAWRKTPVDTFCDGGGNPYGSVRASAGSILVEHYDAGLVFK